MVKPSICLCFNMATECRFSLSALRSVPNHNVNLSFFAVVQNRFNFKSNYRAPVFLSLLSSFPAEPPDLQTLSDCSLSYTVENFQKQQLQDFVFILIACLVCVKEVVGKVQEQTSTRDNFSCSGNLKHFITIIIRPR